MFPKLMETKGMGGVIIKLLLIMIGSVAALIGADYTLSYFQRSNERDFKNMIVAWSVVALMCLIGLGLSIVHKARIRRFDPNLLSDQASRIAIGQSRAVSRAEFERETQERERSSR